MISAILGGIGLFLLGMILLTDGLKSLAGEALRDTLMRFTGGPVRGLISGMGATAILQSSSATVLTTIGFVSAGLLTFPQAIGVILGASLGTTSTGWIVSLVGLKLSLGTIALPIIGIGALLRLLGRRRIAAAGLSLAGFGLIFVGIDTLQAGMEVLASGLDPESFPGASLGGRLVLGAVGVVMTVAMQSSSAAIATTLAAVHSGAVDVHQAAALVVGQSIGTTSTSLIAGVGGSTDSRRTGLTHVVFNLFAGGVAFLLLPALSQLANWLADSPAGLDPTIFIAGFHTGFHLLAVLLALPFIDRFAAFVERLVPDQSPVLTRHLDPAVARVPEVATEAARRTMLKVATALVDALDSMVTHDARERADSESLQPITTALRETTRFLGTVESTEGAAEYERELAVFHAIDHLGRLAGRLTRRPPHPAADRVLAALHDDVHHELAAVRRWLADPESPSIAPRLEALSQETAARRREQRQRHLQATAAGRMEPDTALAELEAMRWLDTSLYHLWRAIAHLDVRVEAPAPAEPDHEDALV